MGRSLHGSTLRALAFQIGIGTLLFSVAAGSQEPSSVGLRDCTALADVASPSLRIDTARAARPDEQRTGAGAVLPEHCIVRGVLEPRLGANGKAYGIGFELRLPAAWGGRFLFQGGGGLDGSVQPALGPSPLRGARELPGALARRFAVVAMDGGHQGDGAGFAADEQAWNDFAYAAAAKLTPVAKDLTQRYYGRAIRYSYFVGCSNGGREAMMAAQRDPSAFDGVVAGNPGFDLAYSALEEVWETAVLQERAPRDGSGNAILSRALSEGELQLLAEAVLNACDGADGIIDGLIFNYACRFDPRSLRCRSTAAQPACLADDKIDLIGRLFAGAVSPDGRSLYASWPYDSGVAAAAWRQQKLGTSATAEPNSGNAIRGAESLYGFLLKQAVAKPLPSPATIAATAAALRSSAVLVNADRTDMSAFAARGGKLLLFQGMSDPVFSAHDLISWYGRALVDTGSARPWSRLFLSPGMGHCGGGPGLDNFDALTAIQNWVEAGELPERLIATGASFPGVSRPLCAYPKAALYDGAGPRGAAASFRCELPVSPAAAALGSR